VYILYLSGIENNLVEIVYKALTNYQPQVAAGQQVV
jgi:hypothetical protein